MTPPLTSRTCLTPLILLIIFSWIFLLVPPAVQAGTQYSAKELLATGQMWTETKVLWNAEKSVHRVQMEKIKQMNLSQMKKNFLRAQEIQRHRTRSNNLAARRDQVQNILINEANARVKGGKPTTSSTLKDTAGTKFGEVGHRGMYGDRDVGAGTRAADKVEEVLKEMGLYNPKYINKTASTLEIGDDFELTINKNGIKPKPGTEYHQIKTDIDARNPEIYVSESMKTRKNGRLVNKKVGADYVEIQDHRKKAAKGIIADGDGLVKTQEKMQSMAKGTVKTLDMNVVDEKTLDTILKQNGIKETSTQFKNRLRNIKEQRLKVTSSKEAERLRRVSEDVFNAAERSTLAKAKKEIVQMRTEAASKPAGDQVRSKIEDEIVDAVTKMKSTKAANEEFLSTKSAKTRSAPPPESPNVKKKITARNSDAELKKIGSPDTPTAKQKALKVLGAVMVISDIGQTCQTIEDYIEGKINLTDATLTVVDAFATQGLIGAGKNVSQSHTDYMAARASIQEANRNNITAYLDQWEIRLRKAGLSRQEAREYVSRAIFSGDMEILHNKSRELRDNGWDITDPVIISETFEADDTLTERSWNVIKGVLVGPAENVYYIATAPIRVVDAWAEGELAENHLEAYTKTRTADSRTMLFRKLIGAGIDSRRTLDALNQYEENTTAPLRQLFKEARVKLKAKRAAAAEAEAATEAARKIKEDAKRQAALLKAYSAHATYLMTTPLILEYEPTPIQLEREGERMLVKLTVTDERGQLQAVITSLNTILGELSSEQDKVKIDYTFSCPVKPGRIPGEFYTKSPGMEGIYPVEATVVFNIQGPGLEGDLVTLNKAFTRQAFSNVEVTALEKKFDYSQGIWPELRKTNRVEVTQNYMGTYSAQMKPSGRMIFISENRVNTDTPRKTNVELTFSADGKTIKEIFLEQTVYDKNGKPLNISRYSYQNVKLYSLETETPTQPTMAYYVTPGKESDYIYGTYQEAYYNSDGIPKWSKIRSAGNANLSKNVEVHVTNLYVHFLMDEKKVVEKKALYEKLRTEKKAVQAVQRDKARSGIQFKGPFGEKEGFTGTITINIGKDNHSVQGIFKAHRVDKNGEKEYKTILTGEFLGGINPETGEMEAKISKDEMINMIKRDGKWWPGGMDNNHMNKDTRLLGVLQGDTFIGHIQLGNNKGFAWTAKPVKDEGKE